MTPAVETSINTFIETETQMPVRISDRQVIEVLGVETHVNSVLGSGDLDEQFGVELAITKTTQTAVQVLSNSNMVHRRFAGGFMEFAEATETGGGPGMIELTQFVDYAKSGKGFLVAANALFLGIIGVAQNNTRRVDARILYRIVTVSAEELIGLVSQ